MSEIAKTPLVAALLCSLFKLGADMPSTEAEVYERRFELLLGKWEQAKSIQPLPLAVRRRYFHYLSNLAFSIHCKESRSADYGTAVKLAKKYFVPEIHRRPEALVEDCVRRGVLERNEDGNVSLGHLTYQEYLAAEWLCAHNPVFVIWNNLHHHWWKKTLEFYAAVKMDISALLQVSRIKYVDDSTLQRLRELTALAPLTSDAALAEVEKSRKRIELSQRPVRKRSSRA